LDRDDRNHHGEQHRQEPHQLLFHSGSSSLLHCSEYFTKCK
jgi:hypothetical protein